MYDSSLVLEKITPHLTNTKPNDDQFLIQTIHISSIELLDRQYLPSATDLPEDLTLIIECKIDSQNLMNSL